MSKKPEVRMSEGTAAFLVIAVLAVVIGSFTGWFGIADNAAPTMPTDDEDKPVALQLVPAIEKTKVYASTFDAADFEGEQQQNRVAGTMTLIKSGVAIDTVTTLTTGAAASTAEFNGGDKIIALGDASGYYASATDAITVKETLQPFDVMIKAAGTPTVYIEDENGNTANTTTLAANEVSKRFSLVVERPGDDTYYQMCGIAADYDDEVIEPRVKIGGSYEVGMTNLDNEFDALDTLGYDAVWELDQPIKNFDELTIDFIVGTEKDVDPSAEALTFVVFDCEENLQNGKIVYTSEDSSDADVGLANIATAFTIA
jgi:hypothetical protein